MTLFTLFTTYYFANIVYIYKKVCHKKMHLVLFVNCHFFSLQLSACQADRNKQMSFLMLTCATS